MSNQKRHMPDDRKATLHKLFEQGLDNKTIRKRVDVSESTLKRRRREWLAMKKADQEGGE